MASIPEQFDHMKNMWLVSALSLAFAGWVIWRLK